MSLRQATGKHGITAGVAYLSSLLPLRTLIHFINLLSELLKVRDDELFSESLSEQHDVVAHTPARGHITDETFKSLCYYCYVELCRNFWLHC